jgi:hypothetical protein
VPVQALRKPAGSAEIGRARKSAARGRGSHRDRMLLSGIRGSRARGAGATGPRAAFSVSSCFPEPLNRVLLMREMQRLRLVRGTGLAHHVFPDMDYSLYARALGRTRAALTLLHSLRSAQPELRITEMEFRTVALAAACRDIGFAPFLDFGSRRTAQGSRALQSPYHASIQVMLALAERGEAAGYVDVQSWADLHRACEMMVGHVSMAPHKWAWAGPPPGREFLYDIVANARGGLDVDTLDWIPRDALRSGLFATSLQESATALLHAARVVPDPGSGAQVLAWPETSAQSITALFRAGAMIRARVHNHADLTAAECMVEAALRGVDHAVGSNGGVGVGASFQCVAWCRELGKCDDWVIDWPLAGIQAPAILKVAPEARALFKAVAERRLWQPVAMAELSPDCRGDRATALETELCRATGFPASAFARFERLVHWGAGVANPLERTPFFGAHGDLVSVHGDVELNLPQSFQTRGLVWLSKDPQLSSIVVREVQGVAGFVPQLSNPF